MVRGEKVVECVQGLEPQDARVVDRAASALAVEEPHALKHALYAEKVAFRMLLRARREKAALPAADLYFKRTAEVELQRNARVLHSYYVVHFIYSFMSGGTGASNSI